MAENTQEKGDQAVGLPAVAQRLEAARLRTGLDSRQAGQLISFGRKRWEELEAGTRGMRPNDLELWCIAVVAQGLLPPHDPFVAAWTRPVILRALVNGWPATAR